MPQKLNNTQFTTPVTFDLFMTPAIIGESLASGYFRSAAPTSKTALVVAVDARRSLELNKVSLGVNSRANRSQSGCCMME